MKPMTEAQAWAYLAGRFAVAGDNGTGGRARFARGRRAWGICFSVGILREAGAISLHQEGAMRRRAYGFAPQSRYDGFWWRTTARGMQSRAAFCRRMARLAAKERT